MSIVWMGAVWMGMLQVANAANPFRVEVLPTQVVAKEPGEMTVTFIVPEGYHLYQDMMLVQPKTIKDVSFGAPVFPMGHWIADPANPTQMREVFDTTVQVTLPVSSEVAGVYSAELTVQFQGCKDTLCYMPKSEMITTTVQVSKATSLKQ